MCVLCHDTRVLEWDGKLAQPSSNLQQELCFDEDGIRQDFDLSEEEFEAWCKAQDAME
jgi:hypothetical protein